MNCGTDDYSSGVLERYGYHRLSGYWHLYGARPVSRSGATSHSVVPGSGDGGSGDSPDMRPSLK
ncbi:MAG: hypothetical protein CSA58_06245 [Micrococcales bacterium]|nr:MAG: hypothetical protein CSB46_08940 [Micrococcales bacterium]PIE27070.1 MAG: hypothetical protein CSA58_06245 [Micrococcales bacterium]